MTDSRTIGGVVLCGGKSSRMGQPKYSLPFGDEVMLQRVVRILMEVVSPIVVVAANEQDLPPLPAEVLIERDRQAERGPLEGLAVGLGALRDSAHAAFVAPCDCPLLRPEFVRKMVACLDDHDLVIPRDEKFFHPLAAVYRTSLVDRISDLIDAKRMRPFFLVEASDSQILDVSELREVDPDLASLRNMNTPADYEFALQAAGFAEP